MSPLLGRKAFLRASVSQGAPQPEHADEVTRERYSQSLFDPAEAQTGGCTSGGTYYAATIAAGLMVTQLVRWFRGEPVVGDQMVNLLAGEWSVAI